MTDLTLADLADHVLALMPDGAKADCGRELLTAVRSYDIDTITTEVEARTIASLGSYVAGRKSAAAKTSQAERLMTYGVTYTGRPISPTLSIRSEDGTSQLAAWTDATPRQFLDAVLREQKVIDGRNDSNRLRLHVVDLLTQDEALMGLPSLSSVCAALGVDPDLLGLDDLAAERAAS